MLTPGDTGTAIRAESPSHLSILPLVYFRCMELSLQKSNPLGSSQTRERHQEAVTFHSEKALGGQLREKALPHAGLLDVEVPQMPVGGASFPLERVFLVPDTAGHVPAACAPS